MPDLTLIQQEVDALEELSRQLFLETADLYATKVQIKEMEVLFLPVWLKREQDLDLVSSMAKLCKRDLIALVSAMKH